MALGVAADEVNDYCRISERESLKYLIELCSAVIEEFGDEYLRPPKPANIERILRINTARGFPGMVRNIDFQHYA